MALFKGIYAKNKKNGNMLNFHKGMLSFHKFKQDFDIIEVDDSGNIIKINDKFVKVEQAQEPIDLNKEVKEKEILQELIGKKKK